MITNPNLVIEFCTRVIKWLQRKKQYKFSLGLEPSRPCCGNLWKINPVPKSPCVSFASFHIVFPLLDFYQVGLRFKNQTVAHLL